MEDTLKALEEKVALLEAKLGKKSESKAGASGSSPTTSPENPLRIKLERLLCDVQRKLVGLDTEI